MIKADNLTKRFQGVTAVDHIHAEIQDGTVFGLIGTNGAGKSTFLRMAAGILKPDEGTITLDGEAVFEDTRVKARCFYIPDEPYFLGNGTADDMKTFYRPLRKTSEELRARRTPEDPDLFEGHEEAARGAARHLRRHGLSFL